MLNRSLICAALLTAFVPMANADGLSKTSNTSRLSDPFSTAALLQPPQPLTLADDNQFQPCPSLRNETALSLSAVVNATLCGNPQTREVWANARAQAADVGVAESAWLPTLDATIGASRNASRGGALPAKVTRNQRDYDLSLSWLVYDFGGREAGIKSARELLTAASAAQDATVQLLFLSAVQAYYQLQANQAALDAATEAEKAAQESFNAAEARYRIGVATPADKLQAQTAWSQATLNRISAEGNLRNAQGNLANVMGLNAATPLPPLPSATQRGAQGEPPSAQLDPGALATIKQLIEEAEQRRPDLRAAEARSRAARAAIDSARASGRPSISLGINGGETQYSNGLPDAKSAALGVSLNIPLFSGFNTTYKVRAAEARAQASEAQSEQVRLQVALDVWNNYQSLTTATQTIRTTADLLASAEQSQRMALGRYKAGMGNILDVLNAQSALASARQQRVQALYNWNVTRVSLAQAMGTLDRGLIESFADTPTP